MAENARFGRHLEPWLGPVVSIAAAGGLYCFVYLVCLLAAPKKFGNSNGLLRCRHGGSPILARIFGRHLSGLVRSLSPGDLLSAQFERSVRGDGNQPRLAGPEAFTHRRGSKCFDRSLDRLEFKPANRDLS